ncbi:hypothetical protein ACTHGU_01035 [Chitinophagaceae bacterium MMS25-I14]
MDNIINTPIISSDLDAFWSDFPAKSEWKVPCGNLVLTHPFAQGSVSDVQLQKILKACTLSEDQYNVIQLPADQKIAWHKLRDLLKPRNVILFGIEPAQLGVSVHFMPHQVNRFNDCSWIPTLDIEQLEQYPDIKKHLWNYGLKPVFVDRVYGG